MANNIIYRPGVHVGEISAEDDDFFLSECFIKQEFYSQLLDSESPKSLIVGRTGSGKTALLKHIESTRTDTIRLDPKEIAFDYISNSNVINFVIDIGCDLNLLFQLMWKHILVSNSIKKYFNDRNTFESALDRLFDRENTVRKYFEKYQNKFWIEQDIVVRELSNEFETKIASSIEGAVGPEKLAQIKSNLSGSETVSVAERKEIQHRVKSAVSNIQMKEMNQAIDGLNKLMDNRQRHFYILIDDLDLDWADPKTQYKMIQALIETIKNFRRLRNVKVLAALRSDVYEKSITVYDSDGMQPEKYEGIVVNIKWDKASLRTLIDKRISFMFTRKYSRSEVVRFENIFPDKIRSQPSFDYICDRTLMRPRDLIIFVNLILDAAAGHATISQKTVADVEATYSRKRLDALKVEWRSIHPKLDAYLSLLHRQTGKNDILSLASRDNLVDVCLALMDLEGTDKHKDDCFAIANQYSKRENPRKLFELAAVILSVLYKTGAIELKISKQDTYYASYRNDAIVDPVQITEDAAYRVAPMLWRALGITPNL